MSFQCRHFRRGGALNLISRQSCSTSRMHPVSMRLAKLDVQADDLASVLEDARERWMAEKDPAFKAVLEIVYDEYVSREKRINARIAVLEAKLSSSQAANGGGADHGHKRPRVEDLHAPEPPSNVYGSLSPFRFGSPPSLRGPIRDTSPYSRGPMQEPYYR